MGRTAAISAPPRTKAFPNTIRTGAANTMSIATERPPMISLYTGAGGLDFGFEAAGFETRVGLEFDSIAVSTIGANRDWPMIHRDILSTTSTEILEAGTLQVGEAALLIGGPPCQPFSKSAYWANGDAKRLDDPRARTLDEFMRVVDQTLPVAFLLENVHGINYSGKEEGLRHLLRMLTSINERNGTNYSPAWAVLNAVDFGVPQLRSRFFMVAHRHGFQFEFPQPTHGPDHPLRPHVTAWAAIGKLNVDPLEDLGVRGKWGDLLPSIPEGENYLWHTERKGGMPLFGWRRRYWSFLLKLAKNRPSWTIQASPGPAVGPFHWQNRRLSVREMAALQTFPAEIVFKGSRGAIQRQIGNAVPSLLAEVLAREIKKQYFGVSDAGPLALAVPEITKTPPPEPVAAVLPKYHALVGTDDAHPGTGRGRSALAGTNST